MRLMRANYDKPHRCPGWSGPGWGGIKNDVCEGTTSIRDRYDGPFWQWKLRRHDECGTVTLPYVLRWLEWETYWLKVGIWRFNRKYGR